MHYHLNIRIGFGDIDTGDIQFQTYKNTKPATSSLIAITPESVVFTFRVE